MSDENKEELETSQNQDLEENQEEETEEEESKEESSDGSDELSDRERQFLARAKKAESKLKKQSSKKPKTESSLSREEGVIVAQGYNLKELNLANKIAKVDDISITEAIEDSVFKARHEERLNKEKADKSELGASKGSGRSKPEKPVKEMTKDEHKEYFNKMVND